MPQEATLCRRLRGLAGGRTPWRTAAGAGCGPSGARLSYSQPPEDIQVPTTDLPCLSSYVMFPGALTKGLGAALPLKEEGA